MQQQATDPLPSIINIYTKVRQGYLVRDGSAVPLILSLLSRVLTPLESPGPYQRPSHTFSLPVATFCSFHWGKAEVLQVQRCLSKRSSLSQKKLRVLCLLLLA